MSDVIFCGVYLLLPRGTMSPPTHGLRNYVSNDRIIIPFTSNVRFFMLSKFECQISFFSVSTSYFLGEPCLLPHNTMLVGPAQIHSDMMVATWVYIQ